MRAQRRGLLVSGIGPEKVLQDLLHAHKPGLCELALDRIRAAAGAEYLAQRPYPEVNEFLFIPIGDTGYQAYIEYFFNQQPEAGSPDSDIWWAIIQCPHAVESFPSGSEAYIIGLGWYVAWHLAVHAAVRHLSSLPSHEQC